jgi:predicted transglutaminase-like cysteine proteinase
VFRSSSGAFCAAVSIALFSSAPAVAAKSRGPTVFGTAVLPTSSTPYDSRWSRAQSQGLGAGAHIAVAARGLEGLERLRFVNSAVNRAIAYREDRHHGRTGDDWASAAQSFGRGWGDCEDYAIAKMQVLRAAGVPAADLFLVIGNDLAARSAHALLIVRAGGKFWVLDNLSDQVRADSQYRDFRPVITLSNSGSWLHGYRIGAAG